MPTVAANGIEIYYERAGSGPPLLFLNGSGATLETSGLLIKPFTESFDVAAHDQRGLGRTTVPPGGGRPGRPPSEEATPASLTDGGGAFTMADYAADAVAVIDDVGWDRCAVVGVSFGGMVAQELAVSWPERITRLALLCTSPGGANASYPLHELADLPPAEAAAKGFQLLDTRFTPEWLASHPNDQALAEFFAARRTAPKDSEQQRGEAEQLAARSNHDVNDRLGAVTCPTLVASGCYDGIAPPANGEAIASRIPRAELRLYDGGHAFFVQDPSALPEVMEFLAATD